MSPQRINTRDNPTLEGSARVCVAGSPVPPLWALGLAVLTLLLSAILALVPFGIHVGISETCDSTNITRGVYLERCEAMASQLTPGDTAKEFIKKMAQASGLAAGDLVTATLGIAAVGSGMALASSQGQQWGMTAADALSNVVEAADYPDYDNLTTEQKTLWGSKENYDSAKYVSLMNGLGFQTEYERFEQLQGSGGGNFEFEDDAQDRLNQFYRIGSLWQSRLGVLFGDIAGLITNMSAIKEFPATGISEVGQINKEDFEDWPVSSINSLQYSIGNRFQAYTSSSNYYYTLTTSSDVYCLLYVNSSNKFTYTFFSLGSFSYGVVMNSNEESSPTPTYPVSTVTVNGHEFYYVQNALTGNPTTTNVIGIVNAVNSTPADDAMRKFAELVLFGGGSGGSTEAETIPNYPPDGDQSNDQRIYYPEGGVTNTTPWSDFTEPQTPIRDNETPYNPGNQTQTPEWQTQTEENVLPLLDIKFDKLFPFSMLSDIPKLFDKVELLTGGEAASGVYNRVEIPLNWGQNHEDDIVLDLTWLYDLLNMIRPAMQVLLVAFLLITCIEFWRGILTG